MPRRRRARYRTSGARRVRYEGGGEHPAPVEMSTALVKGWDFMQCDQVIRGKPGDGRDTPPIWG